MRQTIFAFGTCESCGASTLGERSCDMCKARLAGAILDVWFPGAAPAAMELCTTFTEAPSADARGRGESCDAPAHGRYCADCQATLDAGEDLDCGAERPSDHGPSTRLCAPPDDPPSEPERPKRRRPGDLVREFKTHALGTHYPYIELDEDKRAMFRKARLRPFHFIVYRSGENWVVYVGEPTAERRAFMAEWETVFGPGFKAVFAVHRRGAFEYRDLAGTAVQL